MERPIGCSAEYGVKLLHAVSFIGSADRINADSFETSFDDIDKMLREISLRHSKHVTKLGSTLMAQDETVMTLKGRVPELLFSLKSASAPIPNAQLASSYQHAAETFENFSMTLIAALDRSFELMKPTIEGANAMLNDVDNLIQISFMKRSQAGELLRNRHIPCEPLEKLLMSISDNLETASQMMKSDDWYDHASMKKNKNIIAAIECAVG
jgi:hypothetical protein